MAASESHLPLEITPQEVRLRLQSGEKFALVDVREPAEFQLASRESGGIIGIRQYMEPKAMGLPA